MKNPLPQILATITGHPRYLPDIKWSSKLWTHNIFRVYELVFGRRYGIRAEMTAGWVNGEWVQQAYTFESSCALVETAIRNFIRFPKFKLVKVYIPQLSFVGLPQQRQQPYLLAIAYDNVSAEITSASLTITGSDMILVTAARALSGDDLTGVTYNSVSLTLGVKQTMLARTQYLHYLKGPSTGSNTLTFSGTSTAGRGASYSGASQTGGVDSAGVYETASGTRTVNISVTTTDSWIVENYGSYDAEPTDQVVCTTARSAFPEASQISDTNAGVSSGTNSPGYTWGVSDRHAIIAIAFAPAGGGTVRRPRHSLLTLGVG